MAIITESSAGQHCSKQYKGNLSDIFKIYFERRLTGFSNWLDMGYKGKIEVGWLQSLWPE